MLQANIRCIDSDVRRNVKNELQRIVARIMKVLIVDEHKTPIVYT